MYRFILLFVLIISVIFASLSLAGIPKMINYQGMLTDDSGDPVDGSANIIFRIYDDTTGGTQKWTETHSGVPVSNGLFNVILGRNVAIDTLSFSQQYWLEVQVEDDTMPRIRFTSVGYAFRAQMADTADYALAAGAGGDNDWTFHITDTADTTLMTGGAWGIARGGNTLYGNRDSTHVNLGVACTTGAAGHNYYYCTVGGGMGNAASSYYATVGGGCNNTASGNCATVDGGEDNTASTEYATVGGGYNNAASGNYATVDGGEDNTAINDYATVGGGYSNTASNGSATVGGGDDNTASGAQATVAGGYNNTASGNRAIVGCGFKNVAAGDYSAIIGGYADTITSTADYSYLFGIKSKLTQDSTFMVDMPHVRFGDETTGYEFPASDGSNGQVMATDGSGQLSWTTVSGGDDDWTFRITDTADTTLITGGAWGIARYGNVLYGNVDSTHVNLGVACTTGYSGFNIKYCTVAGGVMNAASGEYSTVAGGQANTASYQYATVAGGGVNTAGYYYATVGGGINNSASANCATVPGGFADTAAGDYSFATGHGVRITSSAHHTFAFGKLFRTSTPNAVIFFNSDDEIKIGIDTTSPGNIITVKKESATDPIADGWTNHSSRRWKTNIEPIGQAVDKVRRLEGVYYDWKESGKHDMGMIAEDVGEVIPEVVVYEENGVDAKSIDYARLVALLVQGMKEQQQQIDALKAQLEKSESNR